MRYVYYMIKDMSVWHERRCWLSCLRSLVYLFTHIIIIWRSKDFNYLHLASLSFQWANERKVNAERCLAYKLEIYLFINNISFFSMAVIWFGDSSTQRKVLTFHKSPTITSCIKVVLNIKLNNCTRFILFLYISKIN